MTVLKVRKELIAKALFFAFGLALSIPFAKQWWGIAAYNRMPCTECKLDFLSIYTGSRLLWSDRGSLYDLEKQKSLQVQVQPDQGNWVLPFLNPPFVAALLVPLGWLSFHGAYVLMTVINLGLLAASCLVLIRGFQLSTDSMHWLLLFVFANTGTWVAFLQGQTSFLLLFAMSAFFTAWIRGAQRNAGMWWALSAIKPQVTVTLLTLLLVPPRKVFLASGALCLAVITGLSVALVGTQGTADFVGLLGEAAAGGSAIGINEDRMHNLRALIRYLSPGGWLYLWPLTTGAVVAAIWWLRRASTEKAGGSFAVAVTTILLSPHLHTHDLTLLVIPVACLLSWQPRTVSFRYAATIVFLAVLPLLGLVFHSQLPPLVPLGLLLVLSMTPFAQALPPEQSTPLKH